MQRFCAAVANHDLFQGTILMLIVLNALFMGAEATPALADAWGDWLGLLFWVSQAIFVAEIAIRLGAQAPRFRDFFRDPWNTFDFTVVALSLLPTVGAFAIAARLLRVLRLLRLFSTSDDLRGFFTGGRSGARALVPAALVLLVFAYVFALSGFHLFGEAAPEHWGSLARALASVGTLAVLQGVGATSAHAPAGVPYLVLFYGAMAGVTGVAIAAVARPPAGGA